MVVNTQYSDVGIFVIPNGNWGMESLIELRNKLEEVGHLNAPRYIFDMKNVTRLDSSGLGMLVWFYKSNPDSNLFFKNVNDRIKKLFEISRLNTIFPVVDEKEMEILLAGAQDQ